MECEVKIEYLTSIMSDHGKAQDVVTEILKALEKVAIPLKLMLSLAIVRPHVKKSILNILNWIKKEKGY